VDLPLFRAQQYEEVKEQELTKYWKAFQFFESIFREIKSINVDLQSFLSVSIELLSTKNANEPEIGDHYRNSVYRNRYYIVRGKS